MTDHGTQTGPGTALPFLSDVYTLGPSGSLTGPAHVTIPLHRPAPTGTVVLAATRETATEPWTYLPATLNAARTAASFDTPHFSFFGILGADLGDLARTFRSDFLDEVTGGATETDVPKPSCDSENAARADGYSISSSTTDTVYWCLGLDRSGHRVLKVTDHRRYPFEVTHAHMDVVSNDLDRTELATLSHIYSGGYTIIAPGATAVFNADLTPGGTESITTQMDGFGQSLYALQTGVETLVSILTRFGVHTGKKALDITDGLLQSRSCVAALGKGSGALLPGCFSAQDIAHAFGTLGALLLAPLMVFGPLVSFFHSEWNALVDSFTHHDRYNVTIHRAAATPTTTAASPTSAPQAAAPVYGQPCSTEWQIASDAQGDKLICIVGARGTWDHFTGPTVLTDGSDPAQTGNYCYAVGEVAIGADLHAYQCDYKESWQPLN